MSRRFFPLATVVTLIVGGFSGCADGGTDESGISGSVQSGTSSPRASGAEELVPGDTFVVDDFTVRIDSVEPITDETLPGVQSNDPIFADGLYFVYYTVTYTGTGPMTNLRLPSLFDNKAAANLPYGFNSYEELQVHTGDFFEYFVGTDTDLAKKEHVFYLLVPAENFDKSEILGTITLGPDSLS